MLVIRKSQIDILGMQWRAAFERRLADHFLRVYPRECRQAGGTESVSNLVRNGIDHALRRGFKSESQVGLFVALRFILGAEFDRDPQIPWASETLDNSEIRNLDLRIGLVYDQALHYLEATAGQDCEYVVRAMLRLRAWDLASAPARGERWQRDILDLLHRLYPEKFEFQGDAANIRIIAHGRMKSESYSLHSASGAALYTILVFMLGSGFDHDDLHPWAARALSGERGVEDRVATLYRAASAHLEESLESD